MNIPTFKDFINKSIDDTCICERDIKKEDCEIINPSHILFKALVRPELLHLQKRNFSENVRNHRKILHLFGGRIPYL